MKQKLAKFFVIFLVIYLIGFSALLTLASASQPKSLALMDMAWGLIVIWIFIGGTLMYRSRDRVRAYVQKNPLSWRLKFVLFATLLALIEEAITVSLTNSAPLFGVKVGEVYITASANYFDTIFFHSVIVFIPLFISLAWLLSKYDFKPFAVFVLFGIVGIFAEVMLSGPAAVLGFAQWIFVYGLMVYLPAYSLPENRGAQPVRFWHYLVAVPLIILVALPLLIPIVFFIAGVLHHPSIDFPH